MYQYPSPYAPPSVAPYYSAPLDILLPARRASLMMFIVGPLILLMGTCMMSLPSMLRMAPGPDADRLRQQLRQQSQGKVDIEMIAAAGVLVFVVGIALGVLAFFVRKGKRTPCILATVLTALLALYSVANLLLSLIMFNPGGIVMSILMSIAFGLTIFWLAQAIHNSSLADLAQQQTAAQYWQYQQNMQAYATYGYAAQTQAVMPPQQPIQYAPPALPPQSIITPDSLPKLPAQQTPPENTPE